MYFVYVLFYFLCFVMGWLRLSTSNKENDDDDNGHKVE